MIGNKCLTFMAAAAVFAAGTAHGQSYFQGFEDPAWVADSDPNDWQNFSGGDIVRVTSGTNGITSSDGVAHAIITDLQMGTDVFGNPALGVGAPYTRLGGYSTVFGSGFTASIDVYLDPAWGDGEGFDYSVAANGTDGSHQRDFVWHVGVVSGELLVNASNNSDLSFNASKLLNNNDGNNHTITSAGWYTLEHVFYSDGGLLAVDMNLRDDGGNLLYSITRGPNSADIIPDEVGGNRYGWFVYNNIDGLAVDNNLLEITAPPSVTLNADQSCYSAGIGDTVTITIDLTGNGNDEIVGGQFFMQFNDSVLSYVGATPGSEFPLEVHECEGQFFGGICVQQSGLLEYAVGINFNNSTSGTTGDATMAVLTFSALAEVCDVASLVSFGSSPIAPNRLSDELGNEVLPDLIDLGSITIDGTDPSFVTFPSDTTLECDVAIVNIAGVHDVPDTNVNPVNGNYRPFMIDTSVLYYPLENPVSVIGDVDISTLSNNSSVFFGLIAKEQYEAWLAAGISGATDPNDSQTGFFGFIDTAYAAANTASGGRLGLGQQLSFGSTTQSYIASGIGSQMSGFEIQFGATEMSGVLGMDSANQSYQTGFNYVTWALGGFAGPATAAAQPIVTDWSEGAYAFVGTFFDKLGGAPEFDFTFSQSNIVDPSVTGEPTVDDNCDGDPDVSYVDNIVAGACNETFVIERTWTVTNFCGNSTSQMQTITIVDTTAPMLVDVPSNVTVPADAGGCDAMVSITPPTAVDNCDPMTLVTYERSDNPLLSLSDPFPSGMTTITWFAEDCSGNISTDTTVVTVNAVNLMYVDISLQQNVVDGPFTRCVEFELTDANGNVIAVVADTLSFEFGSAAGTIEVPCGMYGSCLAARGPLHTLRSTGDLSIAGVEYLADGFAPLVGGDLNDDGLIDILDFGVFISQYNVDYGSGNTNCSTPAPNADLSGDGFVISGDFTFINNNFLFVDDTCAVTILANMRGNHNASKHSRLQPRESVSVRELHRMGLGHLAIADLNGDGVVDAVDVALFIMNGMP
jgi:hypothetical protein